MITVTGPQTTPAGHGPEPVPAADHSDHGVEAAPLRKAVRMSGLGWMWMEEK